jgi:hypothetical protein
MIAYGFAGPDAENIHRPHLLFSLNRSETSIRYVLSKKPEEKR